MGPGVCPPVCRPDGFSLPCRHARERVWAAEEEPEGELWFHSPGEGAGRMMRVTGTVEFVTGKAPEERFL